MYMKFQNFLMTGSRDMSKNIKNAQKWGFSPSWDPKSCKTGIQQDEKSGSVTFVPIWCPYFMQKKQKKLMKCLWRQTTDGPQATDHGQTSVKGDY